MYPGVGWILFRSKEYLPESLVFHDNYLGTGMYCFQVKRRASSGGLFVP